MCLLPTSAHLNSPHAPILLLSDNEYLVFLEQVKAPVEKLPSAEVQLDQHTSVGVPAAAVRTATKPAPVSSLVVSLQAIKLAQEAKKKKAVAAKKKAALDAGQV
jgi:hypothetical protein